MRIFISGPMTGIPDYNFPEFKRAEDFIKAMGHEPVSMRQVVVDEWHGMTGHPRRVYLREGLRRFLTCEGIYMLKNWMSSEGATLEFKNAQEMEYVIRYQDIKYDDWDLDKLIKSD